MYLKRIELQGFKSFADKTVLEFRPGITTVIGPNGSGKSNISDAIRWVLGEQSMKSLRGSKSEDIIFAGTQNRKSLGFAECSIIIDNTSGKLPIEFSEVTVTRRIYRSGESGYYINKTPCRLKDISELFMDTGIGKDGYSIISQGKIDEILSNKSEDRRYIFEEAAGIVKYRTRKAESEKKLEQTKLNLLRINDIITEIEGNIEPLKKQSEKAKKFLDLREELKNIEIGLFLHNIDSYKQKLVETTKDFDIYLSQVETEQNKVSTLQDKKEEIKTRIDEITSKIEEIQILNVESTKIEEKLNSDINVFNERITNNTANIERFSDEIENLKSRNEELENEKVQKENKKNNLTINKESFEKELKEKEARLAEIRANLSNKESEIEAKKEKVQENIDLKYEKSAYINTQEANLENLNRREKTVNEEIRTRISELDRNRISKEEVAKSFRDVESKRNLFVKELEEFMQQKKESELKIKSFEEKVNQAENEIRIKESRHRFLVETEKEKEGYIKSVKSLLLECEKNQILSKGVEGVLANLISLPKEYEVAIEMCLGQTLQNVVTQTEQDAKRLIEYLRTNNLGRASFLPISSIRGKKVEKINQKGLSGVIGVAADLIETDNKYKEIVLNLLGRTVIVEDIDTAIELAKLNQNAFKIVTLKGDIINPSGSISGGSVQQKTLNILGRAREIEALEKEIKKLKQKSEKLQSEKQEYIASIENVLDITSEMERNLQETQIEYATIKEKLSNMEENISKIEQFIDKHKQELEQIKSAKEFAVKEKENTELQISDIDKENETFNNEIEMYVTDNKDIQTELDDLNFDITNLKVSVSSFDESEVSLNEFIKIINNEITSNNKSIENKTNVKNKTLEENSVLEVSIQNTKKEIEKVKNSVIESGDKTEQLKQNRIDSTDKLNKIEEEISSQFLVIEDVKNQLSKAEVKKSKLEFELEQVTNKMWEEYEITPNNAVEYKKPANVAEVQKRVNVLRNEIKDLGSINIDSIEEYKQTKERYDFVSEQRLDLENAMTKLRKVISEMTGIMKKQFEEQFKIINKNFSEVFVELFGGGKAELILTDKENILECGIEIEVQPPGKKLQNMMLLSGGERAFTAIALLFAILKINPAPFCVLDEIEAALDDANVYRYAEYLKKFSNESQFLVITHRKGTMEAANTVYGITMEENGISKLISMKMN